MTSRVFALHWLAAVCRLSMHEKGKKRAKSVKSLILCSLIGSRLWHLVAVVQAKFEVCFDKRSTAARLLQSEVSTSSEIESPGLLALASIAQKSPSKSTLSVVLYV
jgi:hypothetical protein